MHLCPACLQNKKEQDFPVRFHSGDKQTKCKLCEKLRIPIKKPHRKRAKTLTELMEQEKYRFFVCNIKFCSTHKKYHPLEAFGQRKDRKEGFTASCKQGRNENRAGRRNIKISNSMTVQDIICCRW